MPRTLGVVVLVGCRARRAGCGHPRSHTSPVARSTRRRRRAAPCPRAAPSPRCRAARSRTRASRPARIDAAPGGCVATSPEPAAFARLLAHRVSPPRSAGREVDPAARGLDAVDAHRDRVPEPDLAAAAAPDQRRLGLVQLEAARAASAARAGSPRRRRPARRRSARTRPRRPRPTPRPRTRAPSRARTARARAGTRRRRRRRRARAAPPRARARSSAARPRATSARSGSSSPAPSADEQGPVGDEVRIAADRRGEVRVGGAAEPGVAEVAVAVVGLLQRAQHERCIRLAAVAAPLRLLRDEPARLDRQLAGLGWARAARGSGGVGTSSAASCSTRSSIRCGSGCSWTR